MLRFVQRIMKSEINVINCALNFSNYIIYSLCTRDVIGRNRSGSTLGHVMACWFCGIAITLVAQWLKWHMDPTGPSIWLSCHINKPSCSYVYGSTFCERMYGESYILPDIVNAVNSSIYWHVKPADMNSHMGSIQKLHSQETEMRVMLWLAKRRLFAYRAKVCK